MNLALESGIYFIIPASACVAKMDAFPSVKELEIALLDLRYSHTRVINQDRLLSLAVSLEANGQVRPVITAAHYVLVDGYRRVAALKICGRETVMAQVWECGEDPTAAPEPARFSAR